MNMLDFVRFSGFALLVGGISATIGWIGFAFIDPDHRYTQKRHWYPLNIAIITGGLFMSLGVPGFYLSQSSDTGLWGLIGFILLFTGLTLSHLAVHSIETTTMPNIPPLMMSLVKIAAPSLFLGILITGIATWQAGIYPKNLGAFITIAAFEGLLTMVRKIPSWLGRNLASCFFPISMVWAGILLLN